MAHSIPPPFLTSFASTVIRGELTGNGGRILRAHVIGALCLVALVFAGCSRKDPQLAKVEGSEPQRLSFGRPQAVKAAFAAQMQACWFSGTYPLLGGYHYNAGSGIVEVANGEGSAEQIIISTGQGENAQVFQVQFTPFNDNTLISTRSVAFPPELAARMKRDVETWIFGRNDCGGPAAPGAYVPPLHNAVETQPEERSTQLQHASLPEAENAPGSAVSSSRATLSRAPY